MAKTPKTPKTPEVKVRTNPFSVQGASEIGWQFLAQGSAPHGYSGDLLQDNFTLRHWVLLESPTGKRVVVGRGTAETHYGVELPAFTPDAKENLESPDEVEASS